MQNRNTLRRNSTPALIENIEGRQYMAYTPAAPSLADFRSAITMGTASTTGVSKSNTVGSNDRVDYFSFRVNTRGKINVQLTGLRADADLTVFNSSRRQIGRSVLTGTRSESVSTTLSPGTYYARVHSHDGKATTFRVSAKRVGSVPTPSPTPSPAPSPAPTPSPAPSPAQPFTFSGSDTFTYDEDWYYEGFTVTGGNMRVRLTFNSTWAADAMIVDSITDRTNFINGYTTSGYAVFDNQTGYDYATLTPGTYWVVVRNQSSGTNSMAFTLTQVS